MNFAIRAAAIATVFALTSPITVRADAFVDILRDAALKNGLVPTAQLFIDKDSELSSEGRRFFESKNLSANGEMSCQTCHLDNFSSADGLPNAVGIFGQGDGPKRAMSKGLIVPRNTLALWGRGGKGFNTFFWDGKIDFSGSNKISQFGNLPPSEDALVVAVHLPLVEIREMLVDGELVSKFKKEDPQKAHQLLKMIVEKLQQAEPSAMATLAAKLNKKASEIVFGDIARSISAFIRNKFRARDTRLHRFVFGQEKLTEDEVRGGLLFYGKGKCVNCHYGPYFSDLKFHAVPFPQLGFGKNGFGVDYGRYNVTFDPANMYEFRTPPLLNVEFTAPYGHAGSLPNLESAVAAHFDPLAIIEAQKLSALERQEFYRRIAAAGKSFRLVGTLNNEEIAQVVIFLKILSFELSAE